MGMCILQWYKIPIVDRVCGEIPSGYFFRYYPRQEMEVLDKVIYDRHRYFGVLKR